LGRHGKAIAILNVNGYYDKLFDMMKHTAEHKFMKDAVFSLYSVFTDVKEMLDYLENYDGKIVNPSFTRHIKEMIEE
jgi:predicted Rossmann-fold nucleotide-binding protein